MNGNTWNKLQGGIIGVVVTLLVFIGGIAYGYGQLNSRVCENEKKISSMTGLGERLARIEAKLEIINEKLS